MHVLIIEWNITWEKNIKNVTTNILFPSLLLLKYNFDWKIEMKYSSILFLSISVDNFQRDFQSKTKILTGYWNYYVLLELMTRDTRYKNPKETGSTIRMINSHKEIESQCTHFTFRISTPYKASCWKIIWRGKRERREGKGDSSSRFKNISKICEALYPLVGKKRMREIEHLPSFPANLSYARGQWKMHLVRFSLIRTHTHGYACVSVYGGWVSREKRALSRNRSRTFASLWKDPPPWIYRAAIDAC